MTTGDRKPRGTSEKHTGPVRAEWSSKRGLRLSDGSRTPKGFARPGADAGRPPETDDLREAIGTTAEKGGRVADPFGRLRPPCLVGGDSRLVGSTHVATGKAGRLGRGRRDQARLTSLLRRCRFGRTPAKEEISDHPPGPSGEPAGVEKPTGDGVGPHLWDSKVRSPTAPAPVPSRRRGNSGLGEQRHSHSHTLTRRTHRGGGAHCVVTLYG